MTRSKGGSLSTAKVPEDYCAQSAAKERSSGLIIMTMIMTTTTTTSNTLLGKLSQGNKVEGASALSLVSGTEKTYLEKYLNTQNFKSGEILCINTRF